MALEKGLFFMERYRGGLDFIEVQIDNGAMATWFHQTSGQGLHVLDNDPSQRPATRASEDIARGCTPFSSDSLGSVRRFCARILSDCLSILNH